MTTETEAPKLKLEEIVASKNVALLLDEQYLKDLGHETVQGYRVDRQSRNEWEQRNEKAIKLALQVQEIKNFPWANCSNVKFPLLTIAALQFLARISIMTKGRNIAKVEALGQDPNGRKFQQAKRISTHLSLQLIEEDKNWMNSDEQAKLAAAIIGSAFKKTYYEPVSGTVVSEHVPAMNLVLDYFCKDVEKAERITHVISMTDNMLQERVRRGVFLQLAEEDERAESPDVNILKQAADMAEGLHKPQDAENINPQEVLEQLCWLDLDGDGYKEPYVVSVHHASEQVLRIVARFFDVGDVHRVNDADVQQLEEDMQSDAVKADPKLVEYRRLQKQADRLAKASDNHIIRINPVQYYTRYLFIPSPDGGVYGLGLGSLLGPVNESVNTLINQLIDSGTMSTTAGGFLGRGVKIKAGTNTFAPFEWKPVDSPGNDLRANIFPLPVRDPSTVLFQLLGMLVTYGEKVGSATDAMTGVNPGQNTPAETSRNTVEQGMMLFSGIYARMYRNFREELAKFYEFNRLYLKGSPRWKALTKGEAAILASDDYATAGFLIFPACSPEAVSQSQKREKAGVLLKLAETQPGFDKYLVTRKFLESFDFEDIDSYYPDPKGPKAIVPPQNPKIELEKAKLEQQGKEHQDDMSLAVVDLKDKLRLTDAKILELQAKAQNQIAQAGGVQTGHEIALLEMQIAAAKAHRDGINGSLALVLKAAETHGKLTQQQEQHKELSNGNKPAGQAGMGAPSGDQGVSGAAPGQ